MNKKTKQYSMLALLLAGVSFTPHTAKADYASYIAGTSPAAWWGLNENSSATTTAPSAGSFTLTYQNPATNTLPGQTGFVAASGTNYATYFDGTSGAGAFGNSPSAYANPTNTNAVLRFADAAGAGSGFAAEFWVKTDGIVNTDSERFFATREWGLGAESNLGGNGVAFNRLHFTTFAKQDYFGNAMPTDGLWHQIGISWDGNVTANFYLDGVPWGTSVGSNSGLRTQLDVGGANSINLTHRNTDIQHFKGWMDEAVIWGAPRTAQDFADSYAAATVAVPEPGSLALLGVGALSLVRRRRK